MENYLLEDRCKMYGNNSYANKYNEGMCGMYNMGYVPHQYGNVECKNNMMDFNHCMNHNMNYIPNYYNKEYECMPGHLARGYGYPMNNMMKMEPLENMCGSYKMLIVYVEKSINKIMMENMGMMPKAISKEKYHKEMNEMLCEVMKKEKELKELVVVDRCETEDKEDLDRALCPYCGGFLKDTLGILFLTQLMKRGCVSCY